MAHGLDIVAVGVEHEGAVIVGVIMGAQARRPVVLGAGGESGAIEGVDRLSGLGGESDVDMAAGERGRLADPEERVVG